MSVCLLKTFLSCTLLSKTCSMLMLIAAVFWLCKGSIINCLIIEDLFEGLDVIIMNIYCFFEINFVAQNLQDLVRRKDPGIFWFCLGQVFIFYLNYVPIFSRIVELSYPGDNSVIVNKRSYWINWLPPRCWLRLETVDAVVYSLGLFDLNYLHELS